MNGQDIRKLVESEGHESVARKICSFVKKDKIKPEQFSIREAWEAFIGPVGNTLQVARTRGMYVVSPMIEAVQSSAFSMVTGTVIAKKVINQYNVQGSVLDALVTTVPSNMRTELFAGIQAVGGIRDVPEGHEYPETGNVDKGVMGPEPVKRGSQINITEETVHFDQTGQILMQAGAIGRAMQMDRESSGIYAIEDATNYESYYPVIAGSPTQTALYRATTGGDEWYHKAVNSVVAALVDWTDVDEALALFDAMEDESGNKIAVMANIMLVPRALLGTALRIVGATQLENSVGDSSIPVTVSPNILMQLKEAGGSIRPVTSPYLSSSSDWFIGDFTSQFFEQEIFPIQTVELPPDKRKDLVTGFRVRRKSRVYAADDKYVVKATAS